MILVRRGNVHNVFRVVCLVTCIIIQAIVGNVSISLCIGLVLFGRSNCETLEQSFIFFEQFLVLVDTVIYTLLIYVSFCEVLLSIVVVDITIVQLEDMFVSLFEFVLGLEVDDLGVFYADRTISCLLTHDFVDKIDGLSWKLDERERLLLIDVWVHHESFGEGAQPRVASHKGVGSTTWQLLNLILFGVKPAHGHVCAPFECLRIVIVYVLVFFHASKEVFWKDTRALSRQIWISRTVIDGWSSCETTLHWWLRTIL